MFNARRFGPVHGFTVAAFLAPVIVGQSAAYAYTYLVCPDNRPVKWESNEVVMEISTVSMPPGGSWDVRFQNAMWHWNNVKGSNFLFYYRRDTTGTHRFGNGVNEIYFAQIDDPNVLGVTKKKYHRCGNERGFIEADMEFNTNKSFTSGVIDYNDLDNDIEEPYRFEGVALHELGHALGLGHEDNVLATMNSTYPAGGPIGHWKEWDPLGDDRLGVRFLYPDDTTETDIAASVFTQFGLVSSETSTSSGTDTSIEFTFSNQSTSRRTFNIGFYLSSNDVISTGDVLLGTNSNAWADAGFVGTFTRELHIPDWVEPGRYWIGFIVDFDGINPENNEDNNYMEMPRPIDIE